MGKSFKNNFPRKIFRAGGLELPAPDFSQAKSYYEIEESGQRHGQYIIRYDNKNTNTTVFLHIVSPFNNFKIKIHKPPLIYVRDGDNTKQLCEYLDDQYNKFDYELIFDEIKTYLSAHYNIDIETDYYQSIFKTRISYEKYKDKIFLDRYNSDQFTSNYDPCANVCILDPSKCNGLRISYGQIVRCRLYNKCIYSDKTEYEFSMYTEEYLNSKYDKIKSKVDEGRKICGSYPIYGQMAKEQHMYGKRNVRKENLYRAFIDGYDEKYRKGKCEVQAKISKRKRAEDLLKEDLEKASIDREDMILPCGEDCDNCPYDECIYDTDEKIDSALGIKSQGFNEPKPKGARKGEARRQYAAWYRRYKIATDPDYNTKKLEYNRKYQDRDYERRKIDPEFAERMREQNRRSYNRVRERMKDPEYAEKHKTSSREVYRIKREVENNMKIVADSGKYDEYFKLHGIEIVDGLGWSELEQAWYGWSKNDIHGFRVGDIISEDNVLVTNGKYCSGRKIKDLRGAKTVARAFAKVLYLSDT